jgi:type I restriction-modification system DNA methylase subunit
MKGQINTPETIAQFMVTKLFLNKNTRKDHFLLDPGCGSGTFIA